MAMTIKTFLVGIIALLFAGNIMIQAQSLPQEKKILIVYFTRSGNTREMAQQIKDATGGDIFEVQPLNPYPPDYDDVVDQAKSEISAHVKPPLKSKVENIASYDVIFVGSPNWWDTIAPPVATFLSNYDLSGKTIIPFITHQGSRMGRSVSDIKKLCPHSTVLTGLPIRGDSVKSSRDTVVKWLREIEMVK